MTKPASRKTARGVHRLSAPDGRPQAATLARLGRRMTGRPLVVHSGTGRRAEVALTFDDGPSRWTAAIAATLEEHGCRATFFVRGAAIEERPGDLSALSEAGHEIGSHLWSHADATTQNRAEIRAEVRRTAEAIREVSGRWPRLVRPPYCKAPGAVARAARWTGTRLVIQRSIGSGDWEASAPEEVFLPLLESAVPGDIVGLHDGISPDERDSDSREVTVNALRDLVPGLLERGLKPVTVSKLLADR
jgi:peptidoglycan/xylan/chitin deacetylase (PgdA/CDA1 family)